MYTMYINYEYLLKDKDLYLEEEEKEETLFPERLTTKDLMGFNQLLFFPNFWNGGSKFLYLKTKITQITSQFKK